MPASTSTVFDVPADPLPPVAVAVAFVDCINLADVERLAELMTDDHQLVVFDEEPLIGRRANADAWRGYVRTYDRYVIHPHRLAARDGTVAILGHTTGSHLGLPDDEEAEQTLIWIATVVDGRVREWRLVPDDSARRVALGLA
jgi:ketosteroid isomerase-like protein